MMRPAIRGGLREPAAGPSGGGWGDPGLRYPEKIPIRYDRWSLARSAPLKPTP